MWQKEYIIIRKVVSLWNNLLFSGWASYAYFQALEESRCNAELARSATVNNLRPNEVHAVNNHTNGVLALSMEHDSGSSLEQMELGRR